MSGRWPVREPAVDVAPVALFVRKAAALGLSDGCTHRRQAAQATAVQGDHGMRGIQSREGHKPCMSSSSVASMVAMAAAAPWPKRALNYLATMDAAAMLASERASWYCYW